MDDKEFLSYFWNLNENTSSKEKILEFAEKIVNKVIAKQKFEKHDSNSINKEKYSNYLKFYIKPCEDLLYLIKRLIGGILSTGLDMRKGFLITLQMLLDKLTDVNFFALVEVIEKESIFSKSEKIHIKNCILTGKVLLYKTILSVKSIGLDEVVQIFKILTDMLSDNIKIVEEPILRCYDHFFGNIYNNYYTEMQENSNHKHLTKFIDKVLNYLVKLKKSNIENISTLNEYGIFLILDKYAIKKNNLKKTSFLYQFSSSFENFVGKTFGAIFSQNTTLQNFFTLIMKSKRENEFNITFSLLLDNIKEKQNYELGYNIWNYLIDGETRERLSEISLKNYQFLLFKYSHFLLKDFFMLKYVSQIFDDSFLFSIMTFTSDKKIIYLKQIMEAIISKLEETKSSEPLAISDYSFNILKIFGSDRNYNISPNSFKHFFTSLFNLLENEKKNEYVDHLIQIIRDEDDLDDETIEDKKSIENIIFKVSALKQLVLNKTVHIYEELKNKIVDHFFVEYFNNNNKILTEIIEERLLFIILSHTKSNIKEGKEIQNINNLIHFNKILQGLIKTNKITDIDPKDYKIYLKLFKLINEISKNKNEVKNKKFYMILSVSFVILIIYLKNVSDFEEILADLYESAKNLLENDLNNDWEKIFTDLMIAILSKGKIVLNEYICSWMKKISKELGFDSCQVLLDFLKEDVKDGEKNDIILNDENMDEEEEEEEKEDVEVEGNDNETQNGELEIEQDA